MSTQVLKFIETDSEFIETVSSKVEAGGEDWFYMPFWFKKVGKGLYVEYRIEDLPRHVKDVVIRNRGLMHETIDPTK